MRSVLPYMSVDVDSDIMFGPDSGVKVTLIADGSADSRSPKQSASGEF
jgi:hypothetical protein